MNLFESIKNNLKETTDLDNYTAEDFDRSSNRYEILEAITVTANGLTAYSSMTSLGDEDYICYSLEKENKGRKRNTGGDTVVSSNVLKVNTDNLGKLTDEEFNALVEDTKQKLLKAIENFSTDQEVIKHECPMCSKVCEITVDADSYNKYKQGAFIQDAFANLNPAEREFIKTGYCLDCQEILFGTDYKSNIIKALNEMDNSNNLSKEQFISYCEGKVKNLGTIELESETIRVAFIQEIRDYGTCKVLNSEDTMDKLDTDGENLEFITENGKYISTPMINPITLVGRLEFTEIAKDFYESVLEYWDDVESLFETENTTTLYLSQKEIANSIKDYLSKKLNTPIEVNERDGQFAIILPNKKALTKKFAELQKHLNETELKDLTAYIALDDRLRELLLKKEELSTDASIDDDTYYDMIEKIDNEIINSYSLDEIDNAEKVLKAMSLITESEGKPNWYGIPGIKFIYHGNWSDPEIECEGLIYNTYDIGIEEAILDNLDEELGREPTDAEFQKYMQDNGDNIKSDLAMHIPTGVAEWVKDDIRYAISYEDLLTSIENLKTKTAIPEKLITLLKEQVNPEREDGEQDAIDQVLYVLDEEITKPEYYGL